MPFSLPRFSVSVPLILWLALLVPAVALEPLPLEMPERTLTFAELIQQSAAAVARIEDRQERMTALSYFFYHLPKMTGNH
jgi:hypothetical protein